MEKIASFASEEAEVVNARDVESSSESSNTDAEVQSQLKEIFKGFPTQVLEKYAKEKEIDHRGG